MYRSPSRAVDDRSAQSFAAAANSRFDGGDEPPKVRASRESASTVITGRLPLREWPWAVPGPVGGEEWVRAWLTRSRRDARSSGNKPFVGLNGGPRMPPGRPTVCARPCVGWKEDVDGVQCVVMWLGAE